jgi:chromosome segregation ATPase
MEGLYLFVILVVGLLAGAGAVWLLLQGRMMTAYDRARTEAESERAGLAERLRGKDEQLDALKATHEQINTAFSQLRQDLTSSGCNSDLADAERRELLAQLQAKDEQIQALKAAHEQTTATFAQIKQDLDADAGKSDLTEAERRELAAQIHAKDEQIQTLKSAHEQTLTAFTQLRQELEALGQKLPAAAPPAPEDTRHAEAVEAVARAVEDKIARLQQQLDHMEDVRMQSSASSEALRELGTTVYERVDVLSQDVHDLRQVLAHALDLCNLLAGTLETRVAAPARELKDLGRNGNQRPLAEESQLALLNPNS